MHTASSESLRTAVGWRHEGATLFVPSVTESAVPERYLSLMSASYSRYRLLTTMNLPFDAERVPSDQARWEEELRAWIASLPPVPKTPPLEAFDRESLY